MKAGLVGRFHVETTAAQKWYRFAAAITHHAAQKGFQRHHPCDNAARLSASAFAVRIKPAAAAASVKIPGMAGSQLLRNDRHFHALAHHGSCKLWHSHWVSEQKTLNHVESQFAKSCSQLS